MRKTRSGIHGILILITIVTIGLCTSCYSDSNIIVTPTKTIVSRNQSVSDSISIDTSSISSDASSSKTSKSTSSTIKSIVSTNPRPTNSPTEDPLDPKAKENDLIRDTTNKKYDVEIYYGNDAYWNFDDMNITLLRDTTYITLGLAMLDKELGRYPSGFFSELDRKLRIFLITSFTENYSGMATYNNPKCYELYLTASEYSIPTIHHELMHMIDFSLLDKTGVNPFPSWNSYNPNGFVYTNSDNSVTPYLYSTKTASNKWFFISNYSTKTEFEDRAEIFSNLMTTTEKAPYFSGSSPLSQKIEYLTSIIKNSLQCLNSKTVPEWEKYLAK